jgi:hypothetical protein
LFCNSEFLLPTISHKFHLYLYLFFAMANLTNRQIISDIMSDLRAVDLDDRISKRFILNKLRSYAVTFIKRDAESRRLINLTDLWTDVSCVEMCEVPLVDCCNEDIPDCTTVMRSKHKIPDTYETFYGEMLEVHNPTYAKEFRQTTPKAYKNIKLREFQDKRIKYYWLSNGYLIIPDSMVRIVTIRGVFANPAEALKLNTCIKQDNTCPKLLDQPFVCPDYLLSVVKQETLKDLFGFYKRSVVDENPDLNNNIKVNEKQ